jgi:hypothetical protein
MQAGMEFLSGLGSSTKHHPKVILSGGGINPNETEAEQMAAMLAGKATLCQQYDTETQSLLLEKDYWTQLATQYLDSSLS